ncbi:MAG: hypothetical protein RL702_413 [Pseudomonadota bacterium]|jgi:hypothetical protein|nr:hypothetical protein [Novosphingobium sp.]HOA50374.1 hypothetical protein [Novosphingobium sp.]HPZ47947.1 hypothetical protein [Novosphingobium sp.]HQE00325.1 hypothetical protein [Novosphingobium sp.]
MRGALILGGALLPLLVPGVAAAQTTPQPQSTAVLSAGDTVSSGRIAINIAAGNLNQEANVAVIAAGAQTATPTALTQSLGTSSASAGSASARIEDGALAGASGLVAVNVAAGNGNQLANLAIIAIGIDAPIASEPLLEQARASQQPSGLPGGSTTPEASAQLASSAFEGSTGLVQANLVGGERNSSSNTFVLTVEAGE